MDSQSAEIIRRGKDADTPPFRLPVEGVSLEILTQALQPLHLIAGPDGPRTGHHLPASLLKCRIPVTADSGQPQTLSGSRAIPLITSHDSGDTLKLGDGSLRLRPAGGDTITCPLATPAQRLGTFPMLLEMAVIHALALQGIPVFHGAGFTLGGAAVLCLGQSGSGKTTLAAAAIRAGGGVVSDDSLIASRRRGGSLDLQPFRRDMLVRQGSRRLFPRDVAPYLEPLAGSTEPKWILRREAAATCFTDDVSLNRIWILSLDRRLRRCRIRPLTQAEALVALIQGSSPLYLSDRYPEEREALMPVLRSLVERVPAYGVRLGKALIEAPVVELEQLLAFDGA